MNFRTVTSPAGEALVEVTVLIAADPMWFGFDRHPLDLAQTVESSINRHPGMQVVDDTEVTS